MLEDVEGNDRVERRTPKGERGPGGAEEGRMFRLFSSPAEPPSRNICAHIARSGRKDQRNVTRPAANFQYSSIARRLFDFFGHSPTTRKQSATMHMGG